MLTMLKRLTVFVILSPTLWAVSSISDNTSSPSLLRGHHHYNPRKLIPHQSTKPPPRSNHHSTYQGCLAYSTSELEQSWSFAGDAPPCSWIHLGGNSATGSDGGSGINCSGQETDISSGGNSTRGNEISEGSDNTSGGSSSEDSRESSTAGNDGCSGSKYEASAGENDDGYTDEGNVDENNGNSTPNSDGDDGSSVGLGETDDENGGTIDSENDGSDSSASSGGDNSNGGSDIGIVVSNEDNSEGDSGYDALADFDIEDVGIPPVQQLFVK
jgi:hypothetical protein